MARRRGWVWLAALAVVSVTAGGEDTAGDELWRNAAAKRNCRIELVNELGGVWVGAGSAADTARVLGEGKALLLEATTRGDETVLTVKRRVGTAGGGGNVELQAPPQCDVAVRTAAGTVQIALVPGSRRLSVVTVTGDITAWVGPDGDFTIDLATSGEITVDYTVTIDYRYQAEPAKHGRVRIGTGSTSVRLESRQGRVSILRQPEKRGPEA